MIVKVHSINIDGKNFNGEMEVPENTTVLELLSLLNYNEKDDDDLNVTNMTILINGNKAELNSELKNGDLIHILTTINGG